VHTKHWICKPEKDLDGCGIEGYRRKFNRSIGGISMTPRKLVISNTQKVSPRISETYLLRRAMYQFNNLQKILKVVSSLVSGKINWLN
jgi:hypothetical protein